MLEPHGPLPPEIYWRRRVFAIGILVSALALMIWLVAMVANGGHSPGDGNAAASSSTTVAQKSGASSSVKTSSSSEAPRPTNSAIATPSAPPAVAAGQCPDQSLAVKISVDQPSYKVGDQPDLRIVITNISSTQCQRDMNLSSIQASVLSLDGLRRLWTSSDCSPTEESSTRILKPGEQALFTVQWSGMTSQIGCSGERVQVPPGAYQAVAQFGPVRSAPEPFNLTPA
ncbi:hypothetical protein AB0B25_14155 [Nocardia sp. NPDC049190]|uniref:hypothetical protein n=1 Tax=Nocardia sp. NPDC049190 TaxID=3155650 RepID=UPI0033C55D96